MSGMTSEWKRFNFKSAEEFKAELARRTPEIPFPDDVSVLKTPVRIGAKTAPNSLAVHPMEGADGTADGSPDELTIRRYRRFATGGAGLLWFEATAVMNEGRANPRQLCINKSNADAYKKLLADSLEHGEKAGRPRPYTVLQLTHSGRQSCAAVGGPVIAQVSELLDRVPGRVITDDELQRVRDAYVAAAVLAADAGFDAVDVKSCHGYLIGELLTARNRSGRYGGAFENRVRFLLEVIDAVKAAVGDRVDIASRFMGWDATPWPWGWGVNEREHNVPDFTEPAALAKLLAAHGVKLLDVSCGNPYFTPHVNRPFDHGFYTPPINQFNGAEFLLRAGKAIQSAAPDIVVIGTGFGWYRQFGANIAAGVVGDGWFRMAGFGRQAFAYPDFARDILENGALAPDKCCVACGNCTVIMRDGGRSGCMARDRDVYLPIYKQGREGKPAIDMSRIAEHI